MATVTKEQAKAAADAAAASAANGGELPGMPERPKPPRASNGREIENGVVSLAGSVAFPLRTQAAIDYLAGFHEEDTVELKVYGRVRAIGNASQQTKDGTVLTRRVTLAIDYVEGAPNEVHDAVAATRADDAEPSE